MLHPGKQVPNVQKIAVLRANGLGDFIFILPALEAIRGAYPQAEVVLLAKAWHAEFLANRSEPVDRVVIVPACAGVGEAEDFENDPTELALFFQQMRSERFDLAFQLHGGGRYSNLFVRQLGARMTIGLRTPDALPLDRWLSYIYFQHEVIRFLEVVSLVGAPMLHLEPRFSPSQDDLVESFYVVPESHRPLVALHPGAGDPRRRWASEKFAAVGNALAAAGARILVTGTKEESHLVEAVVDAMEGKALNLCGRLSLGGLAGLFSRCKEVVSNDSGPLHLAGAVGTATVSIYWCINLATASPLTRSIHRPCVSWQLTCPACGADMLKKPCDHKVSLVNTVSTQEVLQHALELLFVPMKG